MNQFAPTNQLPGWLQTARSFINARVETAGQVLDQYLRNSVPVPGAAVAATAARNAGQQVADGLSKREDRESNSVSEALENIDATGWLLIAAGVTAVGLVFLSDD